MDEDETDKGKDPSSEPVRDLSTSGVKHNSGGIVEVCFRRFHYFIDGYEVYVTVIVTFMNLSF